MSGLEKIKSGVELVQWSHLASWNQFHLVAATDQGIFDSHWPLIDPKFGRWLCWLAFGIGAENIVKGAFKLKQREPGDFGASHPWKRVLGMPDKYVTSVEGAIHQLATKVRNRDAHEYVPGVRDKDFPDVATQFVPALNHILDCLGVEIQQEIAKSAAKKETAQ
jgi:hypothetical protein